MRKEHTFEIRVWQAGESEDRQQAVADLQQRARQPGAALDTQGEQEGEGADRPSEWSGFIYNPYSGDLLPPEDGEEEDEQDASQPGSSDTTYGSRRCACVWMCVCVCMRPFTIGTGCCTC